MAEGEEPRRPRARRPPVPDPPRAREVVLLSIGVAVAAVWVLAVSVEVVLPTHVVPKEVHAIMFLVATFFFGGAAREAWKSGKEGKSTDG